MSTIKLSIIIATYNSEKILRNALKSVLCQKFSEWECIVIDGKSTDGTVDIIKEYENKDSRFSHISEQDKGIYDAFNKGWKLAKGNWVYYLGSDDEIVEDGFFNVFEKGVEDYDIVFGNVIYKNPTGIVYKKSNEIVDSMRYRLNTSHQGFIMTRCSIERNGGFDYKNYSISADYFLILKSYLAGCNVKYVDTNLAIFNCMGISGGYKTLRDCYRIRYHLKSIPLVANSLICFFDIIILSLRKIKYFVLKK